MKKILLFLSSVIATNLIAQSPFSASLSGTFVENISPVYNDISYNDLSGASTYTAGVRFQAVSGAGIVDNQLIAAPSSGTTYTFTLDMGLLKQNSYIRAIDEATGNLLDSTNNSAHPFNNLIFLNTPAWLPSTGTATNVVVSGTTISFDAVLSINNLNADTVMPSSIPGLGGRKYQVNSPEFRFNVSYDYTQATPAPTVRYIMYVVYCIQLLYRIQYTLYSF